MIRDRRNGYAGLPALLVAGAFLLPLVSRMIEWLGLPRELRIAVPVLLGAVALMGADHSRRTGIASEGIAESDPDESPAAVGESGAVARKP